MARGKKLRRGRETAPMQDDAVEDLPRLKVTDMAIEDVVALMRAAGWDLDEEIFEAAIAAGAPVRSDGRLNLLELIGWLLADQHGV